MALSAAAATLNVAVDTMIAAWETYWDTLATGVDVPLVPVCVGTGEAFGAVKINQNTMSTVAASTNADPFSSPYRLVVKKGSTTTFPISVYSPGSALQFLFHKITDSLGALT